MQTPFAPRLVRNYALLLTTLVGGAFAAASCAHAQKLGDAFDGDAGLDDSGTILPPGIGTGGNEPPPQLGVQCSVSTPCNDFPTQPFMDGQVPGNAPQLFGAAGSGSMNTGPCIQEPQDGSLFPNNWLRPRVLFTASGALNLFEIRFHVDSEAQDLVVYTSNTQWKLDNTKDGAGSTLWQKMTSKLVMQPITVTVRGINTNGNSGPQVSSSASFLIAPVNAGGALIYWTTASFDVSENNTTLQGFQVGDEGTITALTAQQVQQPVRAQSLDGGNLQPMQFNNVYCIGCHTATPDGQYVAFTSQWPWANALASVNPDAGAVGLAPSWLTPGAASNMSPNINGYFAPPEVAQVMMGIQTFSPHHYSDTEKTVVAALGEAFNQDETQIKSGSAGSPTGVVSQLAWFDLQTTAGLPAGTNFNSGSQTSPLPLASCGSATGCATPAGSTPGWGIIQRNGDPRSAGAPNWSHYADMATDVIAYSSTDIGTKDGRMDCSGTQSCTSDVYLVPYNGGMGGTASPLPGASDPGSNEYYPAWSPDDQLIAFNRVPTGTSMYNQPAAEVYVVPYSGGSGGKATRLNGNDPPACSQKVSPGVQNTWPKWSPTVSTDMQGNIYYWVTFSSTRHPLAGGRQQLYIAGVVINPDTQKTTTYSAVYLWNQSVMVNNLIPSWQNLQIPHAPAQMAQ